MGAWSHEPFGNDDANDWAYGLEGEKDLRRIEDTLDQALAAGEGLEAPAASEAIAAIEVIAKLLGNGTQSDAYTEKVDEWVKAIALKPSPALLAKAKQTLSRIQAENSELRALWEETGSTEWESSIKALHRAIGT